MQLKPYADSVLKMFRHCYFIINSWGHWNVFVPCVVSTLSFCFSEFVLAVHRLPSSSKATQYLVNCKVCPARKKVSTPTHSIVSLHSPCERVGIQTSANPGAGFYYKSLWPVWTEQLPSVTLTPNIWRTQTSQYCSKFNCCSLTIPLLLTQSYSASK